MTNPFTDEGIANYDQFKIYPFLKFGTMETISLKVDLGINQIQNNQFFGERLILIGSRGIGKTSALFYIKDKLDKAKIKNFVLSHLIQDAQHLMFFIRENLEDLTTNPVYLLIDFPDTIEEQTYKRFLSFLWDLMKHKNYNKINLIFALNHSHYENSFNHSEVLGKFTTLRLEQFNLEQTKELIEQRLNLINLPLESFIEKEVIEVIYNHTNGVPRNIISACSILFSHYNKKPLTYQISTKLIQEKYFDQVLNDRVEDKSKREIYRQMIIILKEKFNGNCDSKLDYMKSINANMGLGMNFISKKIVELSKFGILVERRGGLKRNSKIISFG